MTAASMLVVLAAAGVSFGWQPLGDGTLEYHIQIEPSVAESMLRNGDAVLSDIPSNLRNGSRIRVQITSTAAAATGNASNRPLLRAGTPAGVSFGWQPTSDGSQEYFVQIDPTRAAAMLRTGDPIAVDIPANLRGGRRVRVQVGSAEVPGGSANAGLLQPPLATPTSGNSWPQNGFQADDRRRVGTPEFGFAPDDPSLATGPFEPYRPVTPAWSGDNNRVRAVEYDDQYRTASRPSLGMEVASAPTRASITRNDAGPSVTTPARATLLEEPGERPWMALTLIALSLFASLGANLYLGWLARDYYVRYREMAAGDPLI